MNISVAFTGIPVADYQAACEWYQRLMGRSPDMVPHESEVVWQLSETGWLYVVHDVERAMGKALLTLIVDDLDSHLAEFRERHIVVNNLEVSSGKYRRAIITDPEGNTIQFTELVKADSSRS